MLREFPSGSPEQPSYSLFYKNVSNAGHLDYIFAATLRDETFVIEQDGKQERVHFPLVIRKDAHDPEGDVSNPQDYSSVWTNGFVNFKNIDLLEKEVSHHPIAQMLDWASYGAIRQTYDLIIGKDASDPLVSQVDLFSLYRLAYKRKFEDPVGDRELTESIPLPRRERKKIKDDMRKLRYRLSEQMIDPITEDRMKELLGEVIKNVLTINPSIRPSRNY